ncbi:MAG TPA: hypothetical protein VJ650_14745 [Gemmatimonadaceae bacterium]|nr:hypothetical protein [Gemmatimonadaceae bacterium]
MAGSCVRAAVSPLEDSLDAAVHAVSAARVSIQARDMGNLR